MPPLVSIIVPAFNAEKYLPQTLRSVLAQTFQDWEAIVSDDGSTDGTVRIAREFASNDRRFRVIENAPARHPGPTRNAAMDRAQGSYFAFLDADDLWLPDKLAVQLDAVADVEKPGICYTQAEDFWDHEGAPPRGSFRAPLPSDREGQHALTLLFCNRVCTSSLLLTREFADEIGPFTSLPMLAGYEDWDYGLRALWRRAFISVPQTLVRYRVHEGSITQIRRDSWERSFEIYRQAELRGEMPPRLRNACHSAAWLVRAETELAVGDPGWRRAFLKAFALDPFNWRRWPGLLSLGLNRGLMRKAYDGMKAIQKRGTEI